MISVQYIQRLLKKSGFNPGPIDGEWGPLTQAQCDAYQRSRAIFVPLWLVYAERELGVHEIAGRKHNPRIVWYHSFTSLQASDDETPWCSAFVNAMMKLAGEMGTNSAAAISWKQWGRGLRAFQYGCVCVFTRPGGNHVAFGLWEDDEGIFCLGGNQSDSVCISRQQKSRLIAMRTS